MIGTKQPTLSGSGLRWGIIIEATLLGSTAAMLLAKVQRGVLSYYIHPRYLPLVIACGVVLLIVAAAQLLAFFQQTGSQASGRRTSYVLVAFAVLLGSLVPARPLGSGALSISSIGLGLAPRQDRLNATDPRQWDLLDWTIAMNLKDPQLVGKPVDLIGFVYHPTERPFGGFYVARYVMNCCIADGNGAGMPVAWSEAKALPNDSWVRVQGVIDKTEIGGEKRTAIIATSVEAVEQPSEPYLYP